MESSLVKSMSAQLKSNSFGKVGLAILAALLFHFVLTCEAGIFSYKDDKGAIHFTDDISRVPEEFRNAENSFLKRNESHQTHRTTPAPLPSKPVEAVFSHLEEVKVPLTPVSGRNFLVDVILNGRVKAKLMLDTGASFITLSEKIGRKLGVVNNGFSAEIPFNTAGGEEWMPLVALQTVSAGEAQSQLVEASIGKQIKDIDGLLGMSFLGDYRFEIDRINKLLTLRPPNKKGETTWEGKSGNWWKNRFDYYDTSVKGFFNRARKMQRKGHRKATNMMKTAEFYKDLKQKLENRAMVLGVPEKYK